MRVRLLCATFILVAGWLAGCATLPAVSNQGTFQVDDVPHFFQDDFQCGPAALAMAMAYQSVEVTPHALQQNLYSPKKRGSLRQDMLVTPRHYQLLGLRAGDSLDALADDLAAHHPVIVLLNIGPRWWPIWHYAVVTQYDGELKRITLQSGTEQRRELSFHRFLRQWAASDYWSMTVTRPADIPPHAQMLDYLEALHQLERMAEHVDMDAAYVAANNRWRTSSLPGLLHANHQLSRNALAAAEATLRDLNERFPSDDRAWFNLSIVLERQGNHSAASSSRQRALQLKPNEPRYQLLPADPVD